METLSQFLSNFNKLGWAGSLFIPPSVHERWVFKSYQFYYAGCQVINFELNFFYSSARVPWIQYANSVSEDSKINTVSGLSGFSVVFGLTKLSMYINNN